MAASAIIRGIPNFPVVNVRSGPGTRNALLFKASVGDTAEVIDARPDEDGRDFQGKRYQWLKLRFSDGREAWARDDLIDLAPGDFTAFGYPRLSVQTFAFTLTRDESQAEPVNPLPNAPTRPSVSSTGVLTPAPATPASPPVTETGVLTPEPEEEGCIAVVIGGRTTVNARPRPSTRTDVSFRPERGARVSVLEVQPDEQGGDLRWVRVLHNGQEGWIREDLLSFKGAACESMGLAVSGLYPAPMAEGQYWWVRGFTGPQPQHPGWDLGAAQGEPVLSGPNQGQVIVSFTASKPTADKPRTLDHGLQLGDPRIFGDPGWGFGYGHFVVVRYQHDQLTAPARRLLAEQGKAGWHIAVMYAHLHTVDVLAGTLVSAGKPVGTCGTTGNSMAPHLHLEVRATDNPNETSWARMASGLIEPGVLFNR